MLFAHHHTGACRHTARACTTRPSEGAKALDDGHHGHINDHTARGLSPGTGPGGDHDLHAAGVILDYVPTELCLQLQICYGFCCATEKQLSFVTRCSEQRSDLQQTYTSF